MRINKIFIASLLSGACFLASCDKEEEREIPEQMNMSTKAIVKVYNATLGSTRNNIFIDNVPITGTSGVYGYGAAFPNTVYGFAVEPGTRTVLIKDTAATTTQTPVTFTGTFEAGKVYTIFTYDTLNKAKAKMVETSIVVPADTSVRVRFAHFAHLHSGPTPNVDVFSKRRNMNIFSNVPFTGVTDYISYPQMIDTLFVMAAGTTTPILDTLVTFNPTQKRNYTLVFRGRYLVNNHATLSRTLSTLADY
ncbi:MAG TPA: DUF4397 domain-containing protein [Flavisolibacter sp.]